MLRVVIEPDETHRRFDLVFDHRQPSNILEPEGGYAGAAYPLCDLRILGSIRHDRNRVEIRVINDDDIVFPHCAPCHDHPFLNVSVPVASTSMTSNRTPCRQIPNQRPVPHKAQQQGTLLA